MKCSLLFDLYSESHLTFSFVDFSFLQKNPLILDIISLQEAYQPKSGVCSGWNIYR